MEKTFRKLLRIAHSIINEYGNLEYYSSKGMENTRNFEEAIDSIEKYVLMEEDICSKLDIDVVEALLDKFPEDLAVDDDLKRCYYKLFSRYTDLIYQMADSDPEFTVDDKLDLKGGLSEIEDEFKIDEYLEDYDISAYKYFDLAMCYIYINALKKLAILLETTVAFNRDEDKLKKKIQKDFAVDKYELFLLNDMLEKIAILFRYNIDKIPFFSNPQLELSDINLNNVYYNETFNIIMQLYDLYMTYGLNDEVVRLLFLTLCFEELINNLTREQLNRVNEFLNSLDNNFKNSLPGTTCYGKIRKKEKEF